MGSRVGKVLHRIERYENDEEFRKKTKEKNRKKYVENREYYIAYYKKWKDDLTKFADRHCKECDKLLDYRTKRDYCHKHWRLGEKK